MRGPNSRQRAGISRTQVDTSPTATASSVGPGHVVIDCDHSCTTVQHAGDERPGCWRERRCARTADQAWVRPLAPGSKVSWTTRGSGLERSRRSVQRRGYGCRPASQLGPLLEGVSEGSAAATSQSLGAVRQQALRGRINTRRQDELPRVAAARRGLRTRGSMEVDLSRTMGTEVTVRRYLGLWPTNAQTRDDGPTSSSSMFVRHRAKGRR